MIRPIMTNEFFLSQSSDLASIADDAVCDDLLDTLEFHRDRCVGLAANMIGVRKRIIVFDDSGKHRVMLNPVIVESEGEYEAEEGCLSLESARKALRYQRITVKFAIEILLSIRSVLLDLPLRLFNMRLITVTES